MSSTSSKSNGSGERSFVCVFIPARTSEPVTEWTIQYNAATEVSCLLDRLKPHFAGAGSDSDVAAVRESIRNQIREMQRKQGGEAAASKPIPDSMVDMVMNMSAVDCVPLQNNKKSTGFIGLMMYVDDQGKAKNLPVNERATRVCIECGVPTQVLGDAFIARNFDNEDKFQRLNFSLDEYEKNEEWKMRARMANLEKQQQGGGEKMKELQELLRKSGVPNSAIANAAAATSSLSSSTPTAVQAAHLQRLIAESKNKNDKKCANPTCDKDGHLRCTRCKKSVYCSQTCQKQDWKAHKANACIKPGDNAAAATSANTQSSNVS